MTDVVLSPVPYYGGALQYGYHTAHYADMGNGKILNVIAQTNPAYLYAWVTNTTNLKTGTLTSTNAPMRAILSPGAGLARDDVTAIRIYKINATTALLKYGYLLNGNGGLSYNRVITILPNDDVSLSTIVFDGVIQNPMDYRTSEFVYTTNFSQMGSAGMFQSFWNVQDNIQYVATRDSTTSFHLQRLVYNPTTKTMTASTVAKIQNTAFAYTRFVLQDIPNSTKKLFYILGSASQGSTYITSTAVHAMILDPSNNTPVVSAFLPTLVSSNSTAMCALSETSILAFASNTRYMSFSPASPTAWGTPTTSAIFTQNGGVNRVFHAEALDTNYFALFSHVRSGGDLSTDSQYLRVGRYVDKDFGQVSTATQTGEGLVIGSPVNPYVDENFLRRVSTDAFYFYGRGVTTSYSPNIRVLYQPGG